MQVGFTSLDYGAPAARLFDFTPPSSAKVTEKDLSDAGTPREGRAGHHRAHGTSGDEPTFTGKGWAHHRRAPRRHGRPVRRSVTRPPGLLGQLTKAVDGGRAIQTSLVSVYLTDDGRVLAGAVPVSPWSPPRSEHGRPPTARRRRTRPRRRRHRPRDPHHGPPEGLPQAARGRRDRPRRATRRGVRVPRAERLRQDDHDPDAARALERDERHHRGARRVDAEGAARRAAARRRARRGAGLLPVPVRPGEPAPLRRRRPHVGPAHPQGPRRRRPRPRRADRTRPTRRRTRTRSA